MTINTIILHLPLALPLTHSLQLFHSLPVYGHVFRGGGSKGAGQQLHMELLFSLSLSLSTHRIWRNKVTSAAAMRRRCQRHCHLFACLCVWVCVRCVCVWILTLQLGADSLLCVCVFYYLLLSFGTFIYTLLSVILSCLESSLSLFLLMPSLSHSS